MRHLDTKKKYRFLFVMEMSEGLATVYKNLRKAIGGMHDIDATWLPVELNPAELVAGMPLAKIPPFSTSWSLQRGLLTRSYVHSMEKSGSLFDAAFFNTTAPAFFLKQFRRRVPCVDALDSTPIVLARYGYNRPRATGNLFVNQFRHRLIQNVFNGAMYLLPWSRFAKESLVTDYGIPEEKISIVPPGIDLSIWSCDSKSSPEARRSAGKTTVLFVGGNFARKGGDLLLKIAKREEFEKHEFHFVTKGFSGPDGRNIFVHDNLEPNSETLISLYRQADIFVLPTRSDVFSLACIEAMAMGLPVITTNVGGIGEIVVDGENGFIVPVDDEWALLERLRVLLGNAELRTRLGKNGRQLVESKFNLEIMAKSVIHFLIKAATSKHEGSG